MGDVIINFGGGGGTTSDELTATRDDVIAGKTAVTSDSGDEAVEGTLVDKVSDTKSVNSWQEQENNYFVDIPQGAYRRKDLNGAGGRVWVEKQRLLSDLGITAAKIATGQKLAGIGGSYTGLGNAAPAQVLQGVTFSSATLSNVPGAIPISYGQVYTPQPWAQTIAISGHYIVNNFVINPIPSNYVDLSTGAMVFKNGAWGAMVNGYVETATRVSIQSNKLYMGYVDAHIGPSYVHFNKSINMAKVSKIRIVIEHQDTKYPKTYIIVRDRAGAQRIDSAIEGTANCPGVWNFVIPQEYRNKGHIWFTVQVGCTTQTSYGGPVISEISLWL